MDEAERRRIEEEETLRLEIRARAEAKQARAVLTVSLSLMVLFLAIGALIWAWLDYQAVERGERIWGSETVHSLFRLSPAREWEISTEEAIRAHLNAQPAPSSKEEDADEVLSQAEVERRAKEAVEKMLRWPEAEKLKAWMEAERRARGEADRMLGR